MPTYNEAQNIGCMVDLVCGDIFRRISQVDMHLLVVDDNSPDGTGNIVRRKMMRYTNLHLSSGSKLSLGRAYVRGICYALENLQPDALVEMDADFQHDPGYLIQMVAAFRDGADYVIGSRFIAGGSIPSGWAWHRKAISRLGNSFTRHMLRVSDLHDFTTGYRLTRVKGVLDQIDLRNLRCLDRFAYKVDLLYKIAKKTTRIVEIPICFAERRHENSKFQFAEIMATLQVILLLKLEDSSLLQKKKMVDLPERLNHLFERYHTVFFLAVLLLALVIRIVALLNFKNSLYADFLIWDENVYHRWASGIADGSADLPPIYDFTPFPAYIMAFIYKLFSPDPLNFRIFNLLLGVLTCGLIYLIGKELGGWLTGFAAGLIAALYKPFIFFSITALKTALSVALFAAVIYLFLNYLNRRSTYKILLLGMAAGLMLNVRANFVVVLPLIPLLILYHLYRQQCSVKTILLGLFIYALGLIASISPFTIRNYSMSGRLTLTATGGFNLYIANNPLNPTPYYRPVPFATSYPGTQAIQFVIEASQRAGKKLSPGEASSYWTGQVIRIALAQPSAILRNVGYKTLAFFNKFESADNYHIGFLSRYVQFFKLPFFGIALILPLGIAGMAICVVQDRKVKFLSLIFLFYGLTLIIFFTNIRIRLPLLVIMIPLAAMGIQKAIQYGCQGRPKFAAAYLAIAALFFGIESIPLPGTDDLSGHYNTHALCLYSTGRKNEAISFWEMSSRMNKPYSAYANLSLANTYRRRKDYDQSLNYLNKISDSSFAAADKYEMLGDLAAAHHQTAKAIAAYEKSLEINSGRRNPRLKLLQLFKKFDEKRQQAEYQKLLYISSFYDQRSEPAR